MNNSAANIKQRIVESANEAKARWLENYVKHSIKSYGTGIPLIREIVKSEVKNSGTDTLTLAEQSVLLNALMAGESAEEKLAAILYIQLIWKTDHAGVQLKLIAGWFDQKCIYDWNVCDWLCVRLLTPLLDNHPNVVIGELSRWNSATYFWKARASLVPFAQCSRKTDYIKIIETFSIQLIKRPERFSKTAVGWVLREVSRHHKDFVYSFLEKHNEWATAEVIKNATKYFK